MIGFNQFSHNILEEDFLEGFHISETGVAKIAIQLLNDQTLKNLLPEVKTEEIAKLSKIANYLEMAPDSKSTDC